MLFYLDKSQNHKKIKASGYFPGTFIIPIIRDKLSDIFCDKFILKYRYYLGAVFSVFFSVLYRTLKQESPLL